MLLGTLIVSIRPVQALEDHWQPPGVFPAPVSLATVLGRVDAFRGDVWTPYVAHLRVTAGEIVVPTQMTVRAGDVRFSTLIDGSTYTSGRVGGTRWRQTPAGLVRVIRSDVQGDPLDRWPMSVLPIDPASCALVGATRGTDPHWVVQSQPPGDVMHWLYVDEASGAIDEELVRDGTFTYTIGFGEQREALGARRPFRWHITGAGGNADIEIDSIAAQSVSAVDVAQPLSVVGPPPAAASRLPASFERNDIWINVKLNGHRGRFLLDTGTTQVLIAADAARRFGITSVLGHSIVHQFEAGPFQQTNLPVLTVPSIFGMDGILGYEFFAGSLVHIDYRDAYVEIGPRTDGPPIAGVDELATTFDEGMPLARATIGDLAGGRFALDTGSQQVVLPRFLWESRGVDVSAVGATWRRGLDRIDSYLEGPVVTRGATIAALQLARFHITDLPVRIEETNAGSTLDIPLDGIIGTDVLQLFDWWFDYTGGHAWMKQSPP